MALAERIINTTFQLGTGPNGESGQTLQKLTGLRTSCSIVKSGNYAQSTLEMQIYGMTLSQMNALTVINYVPNQIRRNTVIVEVGDTLNGVATVFIGQIALAWANMQAQPDVLFYVQAVDGLLASVSTLPPSSYTGPTPVATILKDLAQKAGLNFENNGVTTVLPTPYLYGSPRIQILQAVQAAQCSAIIDLGTLAIWPRGGTRGGLVPLISPSTGLIGYPAYTAVGLDLRALYNPAVRSGGLIQVESQLTAAEGQWGVNALSYSLQSNLPGGNWFMDIQAVTPSQLVRPL